MHILICAPYLIYINVFMHVSYIYICCYLDMHTVMKGPTANHLKWRKPKQQWFRGKNVVQRCMSVVYKFWWPKIAAFRDSSKPNTELVEVFWFLATRVCIVCIVPRYFDCRYACVFLYKNRCDGLLFVWMFNVAYIFFQMIMEDRRSIRCKRATIQAVIWKPPTDCICNPIH